MSIFTSVAAPLRLALAALRRLRQSRQPGSGNGPAGDPAAHMPKLRTRVAASGVTRGSGPGAG